MLTRRLVLAGAFVLAACAPTGGRTAASQVVLGAGEDDDGDPAVVALVSAADPTELRCTGTLVDARVVLTAAHCGAQLEPSAVQVCLGATLRETSRCVSVIEAVAHPRYDDTADHDLALLLLGDAVSVEPLPLATAALGTAPQPVRLVGFGMTAPDAGDDDRKREGTSRITEVLAEQVVLGADPSLPCHGDSGGPVLAPASSGEQLAAVISRGDDECNTESLATRLDVHLDDFVRPTLAAWAPASIALAERCLYDAQCQSGRCLEALDEPLLRFCSQACTGADDCARPLVCDDGLCRHPLPSPGALGAACDDHGDCLRGDCVEPRGLCATRCVSGPDSCPGGFVCTHLGGIDFYCQPAPEPASSGDCSAGRARREEPTCALLVVALVVVLLGRSRLRSRRDE